MEVAMKLFESATVLWILGIVGALLALYVLPKLKVTQTLFAPVYVVVAKVKSAYFRGVLTRLVDLLKFHVLKAENTLVEGLKERAKDGSLTKEELLAELAKVKAQVIADTKQHASVEGIYKLALMIFAGSESALTQHLNELVEGLVAQLPASGLQTSKDGVTPPAIETVVADVTAQTVASILPR